MEQFRDYGIKATVIDIAAGIILVGSFITWMITMLAM